MKVASVLEGLKYSPPHPSPSLLLVYAIRCGYLLIERITYYGAFSYSYVALCFNVPGTEVEYIEIFY